jgi:hypothetical protein
MRRVCRIVSFACLLLLGANQLAAQSGITPMVAPIRDAQALSTVQQAVAALGGAANSQIQNAVVQGTIHDVSTDPKGTGTFVWKDGWGGKRASCRRESYQGGSTAVFASDDSGKPSRSDDGNAQTLPSYVSYSCVAFHLPGILLSSQLGDSHYSFRYAGSAQVNGVSAIHVQSAWETNPFTAILTTQDWYFDPSSGLPLRVQYVVSDTRNPNYRSTVSVDFSDFRTVSGIVIPFQLNGHGVAGDTGIATITDVQLNPGVSASDFNLAAGAAR